MRVGQGGGGASQRSEFKQCFFFFLEREYSAYFSVLSFTGLNYVSREVFMAALQPGRSSHGSPRRNVSAYQLAATSNYPQIHLGWGEGEGKGRQRGKGGRVSSAVSGLPPCFVYVPPLRMPQFCSQLLGWGGVGTTRLLGWDISSLVFRL